MVALSRELGVYAYPHQLARAQGKQSPTGCANFLLTCFFSRAELLGSNLTGVNNKKALDPIVIAAIIDATQMFFPFAREATLKRAIRNRITATESYVKKKLHQASGLGSHQEEEAGLPPELEGDPGEEEGGAEASLTEKEGTSKVP